MAAKEKAITDEQLIAALLSHTTIKEAAAAVGLSERAVYDRMQQGEFKVLYMGAKADIVRHAVHNLTQHTQEAIETIADVMQNEENNPAVRLQAAQALLNHSEKFAQRLTKNETSINAQLTSIKWGLDMTE